MKRSLVVYDDSEDETTSAPVKRRKLPSLPPSLAPPADDPTRHQGRIRARRHVDGQFASYVYVSVEVSGELRNLVTRIVRFAKEAVPELQSDYLDDCQGAELRISLSRPVYVSAHQRDDLRTAVRDAASSIEPFSASFVKLAVLNNDERTRTFLVLEVGAGHPLFHRISTSLSAALSRLRQPSYYLEPRYHASIAWALLDGPLAGETIPNFPESVLEALQAKFGDGVRQLGIFPVADVQLRTGKQVSCWSLRGS